VKSTNLGAAFQTPRGYVRVTHGPVIGSVNRLQKFGSGFWFVLYRPKSITLVTP